MADVKRSANKVKKNRNDLIRSAISVYLKRKKFRLVERYRKTDIKIVQTLKQFNFNKMLEEDLGHINSFLYSSVLCHTNNYALIDHQFTKFIQFVRTQQYQVKQELSYLFGPLICHLYFELLKGRGSKLATDFLQNHAHLVAALDTTSHSNKINGLSINTNNHNTFVCSNENIDNLVREQFTEIIQILLRWSQIEALEGIDIITALRSSKYEINLCLHSINALKEYLNKHGHVIILNILKTWIHFNISDFKNITEINILSDETERKHNFLENTSKISSDKLENLKISKETKEDNANYQSEVIKSGTKTHLKKLRDSMMTLRGFGAHIKTFKIADPEKKITSASIDPEERYLIAGFDNSSIRVWNENSYTLNKDNAFKLNNFSCDENFPTENDCSQYMNCENNFFCDRDYVTLRGHSKGVTDVQLSSHYPLFFSVSKDLTMRAWGTSTYACEAIYRGHNYPIWCVNESPIEKYLATGSRDFTARLWTIDREFPLISYVGHTQDVDCLAFHPNGNYLATASSDLSVRLWSVTTGKLVRIFTECKFPITCISFSPDGKFLAVAGEETKVRIFDLAACSQIGEFKNHNCRVTAITWNSSGDKLASLCLNSSLRLWDATKLSNANPSPLNNNQLIWNVLTGDRRSINISYNKSDILNYVGTI